jgi:HKD family nuclease
MHLHVHVIPRYEGDVPDPRGGVRGVIPSKQLYKAEPPSSAASIIEDRGSAFRADPFAGLSGFVAGEEAHFAPVLAEAFQAAESIDIVAAFVQPSGLNLIREDLRQALEKGASVRFLTGDYMNATNHHALRALLSLKSEFPDQFASYFFVRGREGVAFVGSSNLTAIALTNGIEWNLRTSATANKDEFNDIRNRYEALLASPQVKPLTRALIDEYSQRAPVPSKPEPKIPAPPPHSVQTEALYALQEARKDGARTGLVVMATGLGKTYLSALDFKALDGKRALFIAHREETLTQARDSWERLFPEKVTGLLIGLAPASTTTH